VISEKRHTAFLERIEMRASTAIEPKGNLDRGQGNYRFTLAYRNSWWEIAL
jgi:hypothetical protein